MVAGIVRGVWSHNERRYYQEALNYYDEVIYVDPARVTYHLDRNSRSIRIEHNGHSLNELSMLYTFGYASDTLMLVRFLQAVGCPTSDPYHLISRNGLGKVNDLTAFLGAGVGTTAHILTSQETATAYLQQLDAECFPLIQKPVAGNKGRGIKRLGNLEEALKSCKTHFRRSSNPLLLEQFMRYTREFRVYVIDGRPVEAYERQKREGSVVSNLHQGGSVLTVEDGLKQELFGHVSESLAERLKHGIYGVDLAITDQGGIHIIEVNRTPGFAGLDKLGLMNLPRLAHEVIVKRARKPEPDPDAKKGREYVITLLGDTNPGDSYWKRGKATETQNEPKVRSAEASARKLRDILQSSDYTVANLEVSLTGRRKSQLTGIKPYLDYASAKGTTRLLRKLGVNAVSLANNHSMDFGPEGLADTIHALTSEELLFFGAGRTEKEAAEVVHHYALVDGLTAHFIFVGGFENRRNHQRWGYYAGPDSAGVNMWSRQAVQQQLSALRKNYPDAYIIAFPHWGSNYQYASARQKRLGKLLFDAGADLVIGHGSHMMQEFARYGNKWAIYGLGNFIFNSPGRFATHRVLPFGLIARLCLRHDEGHWSADLNLYPIQSDNTATSYQPDFVTEQEFDRIVSFFMPTGKSSQGLEAMIRSGKDQWGYYFSLALSLPKGLWRSQPTEILDHEPPRSEIGRTRQCEEELYLRP
ncbi:CapA family protein [Microvirga makkahensis]|uniref:ATP-grasp domain-containing protein n=1 Tax=Microvirga makkahensis TaxID=1128670 RepID=A0A7X3SRD3_9HYPH|nr:CapA family protein [Microvirga makkahensis]MXQ14255.1 ATP-grasp domain-containing protein [Microvirga makkahensis]